MKIKISINKKFLSALIAIAISSVFIFPGLTFAGKEIRITSGSGNETSPAIYGSYIAYGDNNNGNDDVYLYNLSDGSTKKLSPGSLSDRDPDIDNGIIVWEDSRNGTDFDIYAYNTSTGAETRLTSDSTYQTNPSIEGDIVVYDDLRNGNYDIYSYNLSTGVETRITTSTDEEFSPDVYDDKIVFENGTNGHAYLYNISNGSTTQMSTSPIYNSHVKIFGNTVVWMSGLGAYDVYSYNITTGQQSLVTTAANNQTMPTVYDNLIAWDDSRNGASNYDIYMLNSLTGAETQMTTDVNHQNVSSIYEDKMVYQDNRNVNNDIYLYDWGNPTLSLSISPKKTNGKKGWYKSVPKITLTANESGTTYYSWKSSKGPWTTYSKPFNAKYGQNKVYYYATDFAGNTGSVKSKTIKVATPTSLSIGVKSAGSGKANFRGTLKLKGGKRLANQALLIKYKSGKKWKTIAKAKTNKKGQYSINIKPKGTVFRTYYAGNGKYKNSNSKSLKLTIIFL